MKDYKKIPSEKEIENTIVALKANGFEVILAKSREDAKIEALK